MDTVLFEKDMVEELLVWGEGLLQGYLQVALDTTVKCGDCSVKTFSCVAFEVGRTSEVVGFGFSSHAGG